MAEEQAATTEAPAEQAATKVDESIYDRLNKALGDESINLRDESDIVSRVKNYHRLANALGDMEGLSEKEREILAFGRKNGGDYGKYHEIDRIDPEKYDSKTALRTRFDMEHSEKPVALRDKLFEKFYNENIKDEEHPEREEQLSEHFGSEAKKWLSDLKGTTKMPQSENPYKDWTKEVDAVLQKEEPLSFDLGDGKTLKYGIEKGKLAEVATGMDNPSRWLDDRIMTDVNGKTRIDPIKARDLITKVDHSERIAQEAYRQGKSDQLEEIAKANGEKQVQQRTAEAPATQRQTPSMVSNEGWS